MTPVPDRARCEACGGNGFRAFDPSSARCTVCGGSGTVVTPVPDRAKAIEAMARGMYEDSRRRWGHEHSWEQLSAAQKEGERDEARVALAALEAEGWGLTSTREAEERIFIALDTMDPFDPNVPNLIAWPQPNVRREFAAWLARQALSSVPVEEEERQPPSEDERRDIARHASEESDRCVACEGSGTHHAMGWLSPPAPCPSCGGSGRDTKGTGL